MRTSTGSPRLGSRMRCTGSSVSRAAELLAVTISSVLHTDFDSIQKPRLVVKYCCAEFPRGGKLSRDGGILRDGLDAQAVEHVKHAGAEVVTQLAGLLYGFYRSDIPNLDVLADFVRRQKEIDLDGHELVAAIVRGSRECRIGGRLRK